MSIKSILIPFFNPDDAVALRTALSLAKTFDGHAEALFVTPDLSDMLLYYSGGYLWPSDYPESLVSEFLVEARQKEENARGLFSRISDDTKTDIADEGEAADYPSAKFISLGGNPAEIFTLRARLADLIVINRSFGKKDKDFHMVRTALFKTGRPVLLMPAEKLKKPLLEKAVIAWNGSFEASRAVHLALPLLKGSQVRVFSGIEGAEPPEVSAQDLVAYLKKHGVHADFVTVELDNETASEALKRVATDFDAGLIVMGAYSRQDRLRETLLGSLTDDILNDSAIPVLMAN